MPGCLLVPELSVSNLEKSLWFYRDVLGFQVEYDRPENRFVYMSFNGSDFMIEEDREREGISHLWIVEPLDYPRGRGLNIPIGIEFSGRKAVSELLRWVYCGSVSCYQTKNIVL